MTLAIAAFQRCGMFAAGADDSDLAAASAVGWQFDLQTDELGHSSPQPFERKPRRPNSDVVSVISKSDFSGTGRD